VEESLLTHRIVTSIFA